MPRYQIVGVEVVFPQDQYFIDNCCELVGIDIIENNIKLAKRNNPSAKYICGDIETYNIEENYGLILALFSILHLP